MENIAGIAEENSAATEEVSASAEEMSAQVEEVVASAEELSALAADLQTLTQKFKLGENEELTGKPGLSHAQPILEPALAAGQPRNGSSLK